VKSNPNLKMISIRLPPRMIEALKTIAKHKGVGYQILLRLYADEGIQREARRVRRIK